jgi:hypothetical protein
MSWMFASAIGLAAVIIVAILVCTVTDTLASGMCYGFADATLGFLLVCPIVAKGWEVRKRRSAS